jgi:serine phosphatase RsbU (regulator of sigma subunit)
MIMFVSEINSSFMPKFVVLSPLTFKILSFTLILMFLTLPSFGQKSRCHGVVRDEFGQKISGATVVLEGLYTDTTDQYGEFSLYIPREVGTPTVKVIYPCYTIKKSIASDLDNIEVVLRKICHVLEGKVVDAGGKALSKHRIQLRNLEPMRDTLTSTRGEFSFKLPPKAPVNDALGFFVNNVPISSKNLTFNTDLSKVTVVFTAPKTLEEKENNEPKLPEISETETQYNELVKVITLLDSTGSPLVIDEKAHIDGFMYDIDKSGKIYIKTNEVEFDCIFYIEGYEIISRPYDPKTLTLTITAKPIKEILAIQKELKATNDPLVKKVAEDVSKTINLLEVQKQKLNEESQELTKRLEITEAQLRGTEITPQQALKLRELIAILRDKIIQNGVQLEKIQYENQKILNSMQLSINKSAEKTQELIKEIDIKDQDNKTLRYELTVAIVSAVLLVIAAVYLVIFSSQLRKQRNEISAARKELEENYLALDQKNQQIEKAYFNIKKLSEIGQNITSILTFAELNKEMYKNVNSLINAPIFGIGIVNEFEEKIEFEDFVENGQVVDYFAMSIENNDNFLSLCFKNKQQIIINDIEKEYPIYFPHKSGYAKSTDPQSLIFLPLVIDNQSVGVVTLQNFNKNAFLNIEPGILDSLVTYIAVAFDNSRAYELVKTKNRQITDSIRYAQTIQRTILPDVQSLSSYFTENFVLFKPKDIVSGDFYWFYRLPDQPNVCFIALADCTGHGVPGAFMSMIGINSLQKIVAGERVQEPGVILDNMSLEVNKILKQDEKVNTDGMDLILCRIEKKQNDKVDIQLSAARRPLYIVRKGSTELEEIKGDRRSVGGVIKHGHKFVTKQIELSSQDMIFLCTDGFADQNSRDFIKFRSDYLKEVLALNAQSSCTEQQEILENLLTDALSHAEQRDDISIIGIKL